MGESGDPHHHPAVIEDLKDEARERGLWNLFLPHKTEWTEGLSNVDYAPLAEIIGAQPAGLRGAATAPRPTPGTWRSSRCSAHPSRRSGGSQPLLEGEIRSCFAMTEPDVASSDATEHPVLGSVATATST